MKEYAFGAPVLAYVVQRGRGDAAQWLTGALDQRFDPCDIERPFIFGWPQGAAGKHEDARVVGLVPVDALERCEAASAKIRAAYKEVRALAQSLRDRLELETAALEQLANHDATAETAKLRALLVEARGIVEEAADLSGSDRVAGKWLVRRRAWLAALAETEGAT